MCPNIEHKLCFCHFSKNYFSHGINVQERSCNLSKQRGKCQTQQYSVLCFSIVNGTAEKLRARKSADQLKRCMYYSDAFPWLITLLLLLQWYTMKPPWIHNTLAAPPENLLKWQCWIDCTQNVPVAITWSRERFNPDTQMFNHILTISWHGTCVVSTGMHVQCKVGHCGTFHNFRIPELIFMIYLFLFHNLYSMY